MVPSRRPASNSAAIIWSRPRISTRRSASQRGFRLPGSVRSRCGRSGCIISDEHGAHARMTSGEIEKIFRDEAGRALATLIRLHGEIELSEDAKKDAIAPSL